MIIFWDPENCVHSRAFEAPLSLSLSQSRFHCHHHCHYHHQHPCHCHVIISNPTQPQSFNNETFSILSICSTSTISILMILSISTTSTMTSEQFFALPCFKPLAPLPPVSSPLKPFSTCCEPFETSPHPDHDSGVTIAQCMTTGWTLFFSGPPLYTNEIQN